MKEKEFFEAIREFNTIYRLPNFDKPTLLPPERIGQFVDILKEEVDEAADISASYADLLKKSDGRLSLGDERVVLTQMADWLGDIVVYCASEARRWGIPLEKVLGAIMDSNFSKLDANGKPIYDERGKVMKGPNYWKPEPKISEILAETSGD